MAKFEIYKSKDDQFRFRLKAGNGEVILASEGYTTKQGCTNGIESVKKNSTEDKRYDRKEVPTGFRFNLKAGNGEVIGTSETYTTAQGRDKGIDSVKKNAPIATIEDLTV